MCCCATPTINGQLGYRWQPADTPSTRPVNPPATDRHVLFDEPGRCGGQDSHCHHYRVVGSATGASFPSLLVRHGGGDEEIRLSNGPAVRVALAALDSNGRYWLLNALYHAQADAKRAAETRVTERWSRAIVEKRVKVRTRRGRKFIEVADADAS